MVKWEVIRWKADDGEFALVSPTITSSSRSPKKGKTQLRQEGTVLGTGIPPKKEQIVDPWREMIRPPLDGVVLVRGQQRAGLGWKATGNERDRRRIGA